MSSMQGKVAIVTGASAGIGRATALAFSREGAAVVVADVDVERGEKTVAEIEGDGGAAVFVRADVASADDVTALVARTLEAFGRLDYAFNNAGIEGISIPTADCTVENWDRTIAVNLTGVFLCMREEIPAMLESGGGAIVNNSSVAGPRRVRGHPRVRRVETRRAGTHEVGGARERDAGHSRERGVPGSDRDRDDHALHPRRSRSRCRSCWKPNRSVGSVRPTRSRTR